MPRNKKSKKEKKNKSGAVTEDYSGVGNNLGADLKKQKENEVHVRFIIKVMMGFFK